MPEPVPKEQQSGAWPPMTPERWRVVDVILQSALMCEPDRREGFVRDAYGEDDALRREVESLLAAHEGMAEDFLEQPAAAALASPTEPPLPNEPPALALAKALAGR